VKPEAAQIRKWTAEATSRGLLEKLRTWGGRAEAGQSAGELDPELLYPRSVCRAGPDVLVSAKTDGAAALAVIGRNAAGFRGRRPGGDAAEGLTVCPLTARNAETLRRLLPFTAPVPLADRPVTLGMGDRLGIASAGHLRVIRRIRESGREEIRSSAAPVLAQQSVRELDLTDRNYREVLDAATWAVFQEGYRDGWGADGDHLKTAAWVKRALRLGYTMITADVSDHIRGEYVEAGEPAVLEAYQKRFSPAARKGYEDRYLAIALKIDTGQEIRFTRSELARVACVYGEAADYAARLYAAGARVREGFDFELSIDETATPTLPQAHVFMAEEMKRRGIPVSSMAPRFVGEFQKGIDYIGDGEEFAASFRVHAAIARAYGYRISVHSGSDKFSVFPTVGRETRCHFHLKTAGTSWLEALVVVARRRPYFFRVVYREALATFPRATRYYHITPDLSGLPKPEDLDPAAMLALFRDPNARQVLHVTYGELLGQGELRAGIYDVLQRNIEDYWRSLAEHLGRHAEELGLVPAT